MNRFFFIVLLLIPTSLYAFWPITWELGKEKRYLGPLVSYEKGEETTYLTIRPILFSYSSEDGGKYDYLYPLGRSSKEKSYFIPIYLKKGSEEEGDWAFFPVFSGHSPKGDYFGIFPLYGRLYNRFGRDEMGFIGWPIYSYTEKEGARKTNILWPLFAVYSGKEDGFKAWPLFGSRELEGVRKTHFVLWPLFIDDEKDLDTDEPVHSRWFFPFYLETTSEKKASYTVLWPFFSYSRDEDKKKWNIPWPIFSYTQGKEASGIGFFPIYSTDQKGNDRKFSLLWPIYRDNEWYVGEDRFLERSVLILNRYIEEPQDYKFFNIWPLFQYKRNKEDSDLIAPAILPFRAEGVQRIINPLFAIYEHKIRGNRDMKSILYGLFTKEEEGDEIVRLRFAFLFEYKKDSEGKGFEFFSGLFGIDKRRVKLFFIPIKRDVHESLAHKE